IRLDVKILDGLQTADGGREAGILPVSPPGITEEMHRAIENQQIINKRDRGEEKNDVFGNRQDYRTSRIGKPRGQKKDSKKRQLSFPGTLALGEHQVKSFPGQSTSSCSGLWRFTAGIKAISLFNLQTVLDRRQD